LELEVSGFGGFEHYDDPPHGQELREGREVVDAALHWLDEECCERPVFLWVHIFDPHSPYGNAQDKRRGLPVDPGIYGFVDEKRLGVAERERMNSLYAKGVREADFILGKLLDGLSKRLHEPLLAIVSDHGEALDEHLHSRGYAYDHGEYLDDEQIRIPLVLAGPGVERGRSPSAASIRDLYTTILEASGIGDPAAQERGRRDLRLSSPEPRIVAVERRVVFSNEFPRSRAGATDTMNQHAIAISDGHHTVLVGADGSISPAHLATEALGTAGKRRWSEIIKLARFSPHHLDDATRKALEALGYTTPESP
jgi:arylsulfatase A-like enzyme